MQIMLRYSKNSAAFVNPSRPAPAVHSETKPEEISVKMTYRRSKNDTPPLIATGNITFPDYWQ